MDRKRPRVIVLTDISSMQGGVLEPDDTQSMVRFLLSSNEFRIEGLIASAYGAYGTRPEYLRELVDAYAEDYPALAVRDRNYPKPEHLRKCIHSGSPLPGMDHLGEGKDTEGSEWIRCVLEKEDPDPVWVLLWCGALDLAQALWKIRAGHTKEEACAIRRKVRVYSIGDQYDASGSFIRTEFPDIFYITDYVSFRGMYRFGEEKLCTADWVKEHIVNGHGALAAKYPVYDGGDPWGKLEGMKEGDTPSFLYLMPQGPNDPEDPEKESWGGKFMNTEEKQYRDIAPEKSRNLTEEEVRPLAENVAKWRKDYQADLEKRLSWCSEGPLFYAQAAVETMMRKFSAEKLPPEGHFHYHQGVFLSGVHKTWELCGKEAYFQYIKDWVDSCMTEDDGLKSFDPGQLDDIQPGILLYPLLDRTQDPRYKALLDRLIPIVRNFPRNEEGGFWHKAWYPNQMWLDGLYMGGPVCAEYGARFGHPEDIDMVIGQILLMRDKNIDRKTGLLYHAYDASRKAEWADPETGHSPEFWGRSIGWISPAVLDDLDFIPKEHPKRKEVEAFVRDLLVTLCRYQSEDGRWYQVIDKGDRPENWLENSCSCLFAAGLSKAVRVGILPEEYLDNAVKAYNGVIRSLTWDGNDLQIGNVCIGTGVGDYAFYCARPTSVNDLHGVGAFLLMCTELEKVLRK